MRKKKIEAVDQELSSIEATGGGVLARMWTLIKYETHLHPLLKVFLDKYTERGGKISKSTILGYLTSTSMTWKTFLLLIFEILPVKNMRFTIELTMVDGTVSVHTTDVKPNDLDRDTQSEKDLLSNLKKYVNEVNNDKSI